MSLPEQARVVIIGGGVIGCSIAYHLAKIGWSDVVLMGQEPAGCWRSVGAKYRFVSCTEPRVRWTSDPTSTLGAIRF